ncbi:hypothetical protein SOASR030_18760 [Leminorella grimontii]|uniref:Flagellar motor switch protein FliN-like C-terminal domain-containing protein n=1 Tax=Leminorella grimontii TaxID=82981 RepID=A0AAV5N230_9GAMM|nr:FliM/FliN family flagellar motor switch protein [Leminorella grimontii]GKX55764.1 hypothetical protein SOASR030_18760 [Leminorella grimontii]
MLKYSQTPGIFKLEGNRLGRPYHRLPTMFMSKFDVIDSRLNNYFLKKHRTSITLKKIDCEMDVTNKTAELMASQVGHLAFDIDRPLLLTLLSNFYGLEEARDDASPDRPTKTEMRLKSRLAMDICSLIFHKDTLGIPLSIKIDTSTVCTRWAYQIALNLTDDENGRFYILLDDAHTDHILNFLRKKETARTPEDARQRLENRRAAVDALANTLPLTLRVNVAQFPLSVADLATLKAGDILPISLPETFPVCIGKSEIFHALIVEDREKLYLSEITETTTEKSYE